VPLLADAIRHRQIGVVGQLLQSLNRSAVTKDAVGFEISSELSQERLAEPGGKLLSSVVAGSAASTTEIAATVALGIIAQSGS